MEKASFTWIVDTGDNDLGLGYFKAFKKTLFSITVGTKMLNAETGLSKSVLNFKTGQFMVQHRQKSNPGDNGALALVEAPLDNVSVCYSINKSYRALSKQLQTCAMP